MDPVQRARQRLAALQTAGLLRRPPSISERRGVCYHLDGHPVVGFCSNDYLGLADDPRLQPDTPGPSGSGASRLICGDLPDHRALETRLATLAGTDDAILFPSGFQLNVGVLPALLEPDDLVDSDALVHASLIDGIRLARVRPTIVPHGCAPSPPARLDLATNDPRVHWWITESIFSMDGDPLDPLDARTHLDRGGALYVDEAHAFGTFAGGRGWLGLHAVIPTITVGTLGKAFGCAGAFVAAARPLCDLIRNRARSFVFSTGPSPAVVARIARSVELVTGPDGDRLRERLWSNVRHMADALGLPSEPASPSPIFPVLVGDNARALQLADTLRTRGMHVQAIRPPTVPAGTARLRLTVTAAHTPAQIDALATALRDALSAMDLPLRIERGLASLDAPHPSPVVPQRADDTSAQRTHAPSTPRIAEPPSAHEPTREPSLPLRRRA